MDIITPTRYIECKNVNWSQTSHNTEFVNRTQSTFRNQSKIAQEHGKIFEIHSKQPFTKDWCSWLENNNIRYIEG